MPQPITSNEAPRQRRRSLAWILYAALAVLSLTAVFSHPIALLGVAGFGLYSLYLFRGGRFVLWIW